MKRTVIVLCSALIVLAAATVVLVTDTDEPSVQTALAAEATAFDAANDYYISRNPKITLVEGRVTNKEIRNSRNHPDFRFSENVEEAEEQLAYAAKNHFQAELSVRVDRWISGSGPSNIVVVKGVNFAGEDVTGPQVTFSGAWDEEQFDSVLMDRAYRIYIVKHAFMDARYYNLVTEPEPIASDGGSPN